MVVIWRFLLGDWWNQGNPGNGDFSCFLVVKWWFLLFFGGEMVIQGGSCPSPPLRRIVHSNIPAHILADLRIVPFGSSSPIFSHWGFLKKLTALSPQIVYQNYLYLKKTPQSSLLELRHPFSEIASLLRNF